MSSGSSATLRPETSRRNDRDLDVANRDTWIVTHVGSRGELGVTHAAVGERVLPADYVHQHVELAYASTAHGVQDDTVTAAHLVLGEHFGAASAYVGMTRGRTSNTAHLIAADIGDAREQWISTFARDRADLGPAHAADLAAREAARYAPPRPLHVVLADLREAWDSQARCLQRLDPDLPRRDALREIVAIGSERSGELAAAEDHYRIAQREAAQAKERLERSAARITGDAAHIRDALLRNWDSQRDAARDAARTVQHGPGRLGLRLAAVHRATEDLARWSMTWQPYLPDMPTATRGIVYYASWPDQPARLRDAFDNYAQRQAEQAHPEHAALDAAHEEARMTERNAGRVWTDTIRGHREELARYGSLARIDNPETRLHELERDITATETQLAVAQRRVADLSTEPAIRTQPAERLTHEHDSWQLRHHVDQLVSTTAARRGASSPAFRHPAPEHLAPPHERGPSIGR